MASEAHTAACRTTIAAAVPGVRLLTSYRRSWLPKDVVAGLVLTALLAPRRWHARGGSHFRDLRR
jgi:hypothetical protein